MRTRSHGFTLIEMVIVIAIAAILAAIAIPSYNDYITTSRRADGQIALMDLSTRLERYFNENNTYVGAAIPALYPATSPEGFYNLQITNASATNYTIQAVPQGSQASSDTLCATLPYTSLGQKGATGTASDLLECW